MCFNASISLQTYIVGMIGSYMLWTQGQLPLAAFYATVVQMQLIEFVLWTTVPSIECSTMNSLATKAGIVINHAEPLVLYGVLAATTTLPLGVHILAGLYACMTLKYTFRALASTTCTRPSSECTRPSSECSDGHLQWTWNYQEGYGLHYILFLALLVALSVYGLPEPLGMWHAGVVLITFMTSYHMYGTEKSVGALWCFFAAFIPFFWVLFVTPP